TTVVRVGMGMGSDSAKPESQQPARGCAHEDLAALGDQLSLVDHAAVDQILIHKRPIVGMQIRLETEGVSKLPAADGKSVVDTRVEISLLEFGLPDVVFPLVTKTRHAARHFSSE